MNLSQEETKLIARIKKRQEYLVLQRLCALVGAIWSIAVGLWAAVKARQCLLEPDPTFKLFLAVLSPLALIGFASAAAWLIYLFARWNGSAEARLLLKLTDQS